MATSKIKSNAWTVIGASSGNDISLPTNFTELLVDLYQPSLNARSVDSTVVPKVRIDESPNGDDSSAGLALLWEGANLHYVVYKKSPTILGVKGFVASDPFLVRVYAR